MKPTHLKVNGTQPKGALTPQPMSCQADKHRAPGWCPPLHRMALGRASSLRFSDPATRLILCPFPHETRGDFHPPDARLFENAPVVD